MSRGVTPLGKEVHTKEVKEMAKYRVQATRIRRYNRAEYVKAIKVKKIKRRVTDALNTVLLFTAFFVIPFVVPAIVESIM